MSQEITRNLNGDSPFEERVFARFDGIEAYLRSLDPRVQVLESRSYDTKPLWERALKEILETRLEFGELKTEVAGVKSSVTELHTDVGGLKNTGGELHSLVTGLQTEVSGFKSSVTDLQLEVKELNREVKREVIKRLDQSNLCNFGTK